MTGYLKMLDYKQIEALAKVVQEGGFERAARALCLTQSAISQRVRQLEEMCGLILLTRSSPPKPTSAGQALLKHYQQVSLLEEGLSLELQAENNPGPPTLAIGINADSLASWFFAALRPLLRQPELLIDLRVDDQEQTHRYLRDGEVVGCISTEATAMQGCRVEYLGRMDYRLLATSGFAKRWFAAGVSLAATEQAPAVIFNARDRLHHRFLERFLGTAAITFPAHYIPAPEQFLQVIAEGYCYGMVPHWQSADLLDSGRLQDLLPDAVLPVELYWHCWNLESRPLQSFSRQLLREAKSLLSQ